LSEALDDFFEAGEKLGWCAVDLQSETTVEKDHGRIETRRALLVTDISWMETFLRNAWANLGAVGMIETTQETRTKVSLR
jgi:hypothetical protein